MRAYCRDDRSEKQTMSELTTQLYIYRYRADRAAEKKDFDISVLKLTATAAAF